jgi:hypothetical protein
MPYGDGWTGCVPLISTTAPAPANGREARPKALVAASPAEAEVRYSVGSIKGRRGAA